MDVTHRYKDIKNRIEAKNYLEPLSMDSVVLVERLFSDLEKMAKIRIEQNEQISFLKKELNSLHDSIEPMEEDKRMLVRENNDLHVELIDQREEIKAVKARSQLTEQSLQSNIDRVSFLTFQSRKEMAMLNRENADLKSTLFRLTNTSSDIPLDVATLSQSSSIPLGPVTVFDDSEPILVEAEDAETKADREKALHMACNETIEALREEVRKLQGRLEEWKERVEGVEELRISYISVIENKDVQVEVLQKANDSLVEQLTKSQINERAKDPVIRQEYNSDKLKTEISHLQEKNRKLREEHSIDQEKLISEISQLQEKNRKLREEHNVSQEKLISEITQLQERNSKLYEDNNSKEEKMISEIDRLQERNRSLNEEFNESEEKMIAEMTQIQEMNRMLLDDLASNRIPEEEEDSEESDHSSDSESSEELPVVAKESQHLSPPERPEENNPVSDSESSESEDQKIQEEEDSASQVQDDPVVSELEKKSLTAEIKRLTGISKEYQKLIEKKEDHIAAELRARLSLADQFNELSGDFDSLLAENQLIKEENDTLREQIEKKEELIAEEQRARLSLVAQCEALSSDLDSLTKKKRENQLIKEEIATLQRQVEMKSERIAEEKFARMALVEQCTALSGDLDAKIRENHSVKDEVVTIRRQIEKKEQQIAEEQRARLALVDQCNALSSDLDSMIRENQLINRNLLEIAKRSQASDAKVGELNGRVSSEQQRVQSLEYDRTSLLASLKTAALERDRWKEIADQKTQLLNELHRTE